MKTSEIEREYLDRNSVQPSVRRQFGLKVDRKSDPAENGIGELMVSCFNGFGDALIDDVMFQWHRLVCAGRTDLHVIGGYRDDEAPMLLTSGPTQKTHRPP